MSTRIYALIKETEEKLPTRHYLGLPPELTGGIDNREGLPHAVVLTIEETTDGIFLTRFGIDGSFAGDTWHTSIDDAKHQAKQEYKDLLSEWREVPENVTEIVAFALSQKS